MTTEQTALPVVSSAVTLDRRRFNRLSELITRELGIRMPPAKLTMLQSRLQRRMRELQMRSLDEYEAHLFEAGSASGELIHFFDIVTTNKTDFFREPQHFDFLAKTALPTMARENHLEARWNFKLWCAGCSSGQEVYTLSMVLSEYAAAHSGFSFSMLATDISTRILDQAQRAIYTEEIIAPVTMDLRKKYLLRSADRARRLVQIAPELRRKVRFGRLNFMDREYGIRDEFDVIFFRNVMIYFDKPTQEAVINRMCRNLRPGGYLFISHSESLAGLNVPLEVVGNSVFRRTR
ncbi:MAG: CheR family methyltransferase [Chthoniobacteraceae bacterium]